MISVLELCFAPVVVTAQSAKMIFFHFLKNIDCRNAVDGYFRRYQQRDSQTRELLLNLMIIGDATSNFLLLSWFLAKLLGIQTQTWHHLSLHQSEGYKEVCYVMVTSQLMIDCLIFGLNVSQHPRSQFRESSCFLELRSHHETIFSVI